MREFLERDLGRRTAPFCGGGSHLRSTCPNPYQRCHGCLDHCRVLPRSGADVLFMMDSVTRFCHRPAGSRAGHWGATCHPGLYTLGIRHSAPALGAQRARIQGHHHCFYTVLVEGDDMNEPVADTVRGLLDGHIVLRDPRAQHYPAIDVLASVSRLMTEVVGPEHLQPAGKFRSLWPSIRMQRT